MVWPINGDPYFGAIGVRAGLVLGALWLALPNIRRAPRWLLSSIGVLAAVLIVRPRLILYALPIAILVSIVGAGSRRSTRS
jgi:hypothetical protein